MNERLTDRRCDEEAARLLPWYVSGRLDAGDCERVARHLEHCPICRDDLDHERALRALLKSESSLQYAPQPGLAKTLARIDELEREPSDAMRAAAPSEAPGEAAGILEERSARRVGALRWLAAAVLVQGVALGALGTALFHRSNEAGREPLYTTLASEGPSRVPGEHIRAVFSPSLSVGALKALLADNGLTIIAGPSDAGAYTLALTGPRASGVGLEHAIAGLRSDVRVMFVEPAVNDGVGGR
ncbi:MAG TPA: zf-HC2 domain-containing protein [Steroidobacteraceae bacterium]|nr:zf-HC2 domain-containing protein [Steroidobacteraceae bacterium]